MLVQQPERAPRSRRYWVPYFVVAIVWLLTGIAAFYTASVAHTNDQLRFNTLVKQSQDSISTHLVTYTSAVRGIAALFAADPEVDRSAFHAYVERLQLANNYPGIRGIGFTVLISPTERASLVTAMQQQGIPDFHIWPEGEREIYSSILYLEPLDQRNRVAIGYDMFSEPVRRAAMERARDMGTASASGRVLLVQEIEAEKQAGFLIYTPIYRGGLIPATVEERRANLLGFAYAPFRCDDLFLNVFGSQRNPQIAVEIYDSATLTPDQLLYTSHGEATVGPASPMFSTVTHLVVAGREWSIRYTTLPAFIHPENFEILILVAGLAVSIVLFSLTNRIVAARNQAESAVQVRDVFLSVAAHELKTPLTILLGNAQLMLRRASRDEGISDRDRRAVQVIVEQSQRLNRLIGALLDHSRIQAGRFQLEPIPFDLALLLQRVVDETIPVLQSHTVDVHVADVPLIIKGDELRLEQVFQNLLGNAIKYSPDGGVITIRARARDEQILVEIADQGIGIPEDALPYLFEPFYRAANTEARRIAGMGIGLYLVKEIVTRHGGTVTVESAEGKGSVFTVTFPRSRSLSRATQPHSDTSSHNRDTAV